MCRYKCAEDEIYCMSVIVHRTSRISDQTENIILKLFYGAFSLCISFIGSQEFSIDPVDRYVPSDFATEDGFYFSNPIKHSLDGAFATRLVRDSESRCKYCNPGDFSRSI